MGLQLQVRVDQEIISMIGLFYIHQRSRAVTPPSGDLVSYPIVSYPAPLGQDMKQGQFLSGV